MTEPPKDKAADEFTELSVTTHSNLTVARVAAELPLQLTFADGVGRHAICAASQMYELRCGDEVLAAMSNGKIWVLQVLKFADSSSRQLNIHGATSIHLLTQQLEIKAESLQIHALRSTFRTGELRFSAKSVIAVCHKISTWTRNWYLRAHVAAMRANQRISRVDAVDVVRAQEVDIQVAGVHAVSANEARVTAEGNVAVQGSKVLLG